MTLPPPQRSIITLLAVMLTTSFAFAQAPSTKGGGNATTIPDRPKLPDLPAVPDAVLAKWANLTSDIEKLDGEIRRIEYEEVFGVEKHSKGKFYYARPDKGRIDLKGMKFPEGTKGKKFPLANGDTEEWVCDGQHIYQIQRDLAQPEASIFPIPEDHRGQNIMHGPLPFLFGMPPEVAKKRFHLFLKSHNADSAYILAYPKTVGDAQNYRYAEIILAKSTYLPIAVKLRNPANTGDTVYTFENIVKDRRITIFRGDPFKPDLRGVKPVNKVPAKVANAPGGQPRAPLGPGPAVMPSFVGLHGRDVAKMCKTLGVEARFLRGSAAVRPELKHRVYKQEPAPKVPLIPGQTIKVTLYDEAKG